MRVLSLVKDYFSYILGGVAATALRKPGQPVQASSSTPVAASDPATNTNVQPAPQTATYIENVPLQPDQMGPQSGETAEQWIASNNKQSEASSVSSNNPNYASVANNPENIPGAEMYMNHNDMNAFEQNGPRISLKRDKIIHANFTAIK